jgi:hypothetical protein
MQRRERDCSACIATPALRALRTNLRAIRASLSLAHACLARCQADVGPAEPDRYVLGRCPWHIRSTSGQCPGWIPRWFVDAWSRIPFEHIPREHIHSPPCCCLACWRCCLACWRGVTVSHGQTGPRCAGRVPSHVACGPPIHHPSSRDRSSTLRWSRTACFRGRVSSVAGETAARGSPEQGDRPPIHRRRAAPPASPPKAAGPEKQPH